MASLREQYTPADRELYRIIQPLTSTYKDSDGTAFLMVTVHHPTRLHEAFVQANREQGWQMVGKPAEIDGATVQTMRRPLRRRVDVLS